MNPGLGYASESTTATPDPTPQSFFSRLIGVYFSPSETFAGMGAAPRALVPIIVFAIFTAITVTIISSRVPMEKLAEDQIQQAVDAGKMTPEQAEQRREGMKKFMSISKYVIPIGGTIWAIAMLFAIAGLAKLVSVIMGIENKYMPLVSVTTYTWLAVSIITTAIFLVLLALKPVDEFDWTNPIGSNLAALLTMAGVDGIRGFVKGLLSYVDVFYIWKVALIAIGCAAVSRRLKTSSAMVYAGVIALVIAVIGGAWAAISNG